MFSQALHYNKAPPVQGIVPQGVSNAYTRQCLRIQICLAYGCVICVMKTKVFKLILIRIDPLRAYYKYLGEDFYFDPDEQFRNKVSQFYRNTTTL